MFVSIIKMCEEEGGGGRGSLNQFSKPWEARGMDYIEPIKARYLLVKIDYLSKMLELDVSLHANKKHIITWVEQWEKSKDPLEVLVIDEAKHFFNGDVERWMKQRGLQHLQTLSYDCKGNKIVERCKRTVLKMLRRLEASHLDLKWW